MQIEILTIGTELLLGYTIDTNGAELGRALAAAGVRVTRRVSVEDRAEVIRDAVAEALRRTGAVITTGGLGPTSDDVTKRVIAEWFDMPLEFREEIWQTLVERFGRFGRVPAERNRRQAEVPRGATVLPNRWGTAPGLWLESDKGLAILLPGVPGEMRQLLHHEVLPRLAPRVTGGVIRARTLRTFGLPESSVADRLAGAEADVAPLSLAYLPGVYGVDLRLVAWGLPAEEADARLARGIERLRQGVGDHAYGEDDTDLAAVVLDRLRARKMKLAVAESCTGGGLGERLTAIAGSSEVFVGGVIAYDNALKVSALGVPEALLEQHGAVSEPVARAMAAGAARKFGVPVTLAVTGIAGPTGGTPDKPVGLVYLGGSLEGETWVTRSVFPGDRGEIRARAAQAALFGLWRRLG
ncbi:MAG TPA: competence/damage-inducible protein A [Gemmatimonadales bacterium]|jgi:nicotinamide-nucleotide amidase|nr:competence/damage-inducible protein A [Gemmatimonadales bacterium]